MFFFLIHRKLWKEPLIWPLVERPSVVKGLKLRPEGSFFTWTRVNLECNFNQWNVNACHFNSSWNCFSQRGPLMSGPNRSLYANRAHIAYFDIRQFVPGITLLLKGMDGGLLFDMLIELLFFSNRSFSPENKRAESYSKYERFPYYNYIYWFVSKICNFMFWNTTVQKTWTRSPTQFVL